MEIKTPNTKVFKFGGASIETPEKMRALLPIIAEESSPLIVVISAKGKTTNYLEAITNAAVAGDITLATNLLKDLEEDHIQYAKQLLKDNYLVQTLEQLNDLFQELEWAIGDADKHAYDYSYDQIVSVGELLSSSILTSVLQYNQIHQFKWIDARDIIHSDHTYREGKVDWNITKANAQRIIGNHLNNNECIVIQGFIGATAENTSVTLGREGSDYTAAIMAAMLNADSLTIWKDVEGLQNADPKLFDNTVKIEAISYHEVIEMAYFGAQVIHPKTIKPLQNNNIPLYIKCFLNKKLKGTIVQNEVNSIFYPPLIILKKNQILLQITTQDFSFITESNLSKLYAIFHDNKVKINLIQNAAISFVACIDNNEEKVQQLKNILEQDYKVLSNEGLTLLTVRHYTPEVVLDLTHKKYILLEQKTKSTIQLVIK